MDYFDRLRCSCCIQIMEYYTAISKKVRPRFSPLKWVHDILSSGKSQVHIRVPSLVPVLLKQIATTSLFVSVRQCLVTVRVHREELKKAHQAATVGFLRKGGGHTVEAQILTCSSCVFYLLHCLWKAMLFLSLKMTKVNYSGPTNQEHCSVG